MNTYRAPLLVDLFLYSHEADFIQGVVKKNEKELARSFNFTFRYIDGVLSLNNCKFGDFIDRSYPIEPEIKDTTDIARCTSYLDIHLSINNQKESTEPMFSDWTSSLRQVWGQLLLVLVPKPMYEVFIESHVKILYLQPIQYAQSSLVI